jgi:hypothetical protein
MHSEGNRFGFYVEPGIIIRAKNIKVQRIITRPGFDSRAWMPVGSELINECSKLVEIWGCYNLAIK